MTAAGEVHFWERSAAIWHVLFGAAVVGAVLVELTAGHRRWPVVVGLLTFLACWYAATGGRSIHCDSDRLGYLYLAVAAPVLIAAIALDLRLTFLMSAAIPQIYVLVESRLWSSVGVVGLHVLVFGAFLVQDPDVRDDPSGLACGLTVSMVFSLLFGLWISGIIRQSTQRAALIAELRETRAALATERHQAGVLAERTRLAAEIHDTLAQGFTSILMLTQAAECALRRDPHAVRDQLKLIESSARENLAEARSLVAALAPAALDGASLGEALGRLAGRHQQETGTSVVVGVQGAPRDCPDTDVVLLRAAQEALANVRKHASAGTVSVVLRYGEGTELRVADDGRGFDPAAANGGFGLAGMRRRAQDSGGNVTVQSSPGRGTTIRVVLP
jgi:signal transduction histidine kinase